MNKILTMSIENARLIKANVIINRQIRPVQQSLSGRLLKALPDGISEAEKAQRTNDIYHNF